MHVHLKPSSRLSTLSRKALTWLLIGLSLLIWVGITTEVGAEQTFDDGSLTSRIERVEALSAQGAKLFRQRRYAEAITIFKRAYAIEAVTNLLYNIALSFERLDDLDNALVYYEKFLLEPDADTKARRKVLEKIKTLSTIAKTRKVRTIPDPPQNDPTITRELTTQELSTMTISGIVLLGLGVATTATGGAFGIIANDNADAFTQTNDLSVKREARADAENSAFTADILYLVGGAGIVSGVVLILIDSLKQTPTDVRLLPNLSHEYFGTSIIMPFP